MHSRAHSRVQSVAAGSPDMNGRAYFLAIEQELEVEQLDPASVVERENGESRNLKRGPRASRLGGRLATDLKHLSPEETEERKKRSESFLSEPAIHFPAEEEDGEHRIEDKHTG